jgi:hypothetical protein
VIFERNKEENASGGYELLERKNQVEVIPLQLYN